MYLSTNCWMNINTVLKEWFPSDSGLKQDDNPSPTLRNIFKEIKELNIGIPIENDFMVSILLYADDMVLLVENEEDLQAMVDKLHKYCFKRRLSINIEKH